MAEGLSVGSSAARHRGVCADDLAEPKHRQRFWMWCIVYAAIFAALFAWFFLTSSRTINVVDEAIELTDAMRIAAGQVIHRDFYYNYGPARIYTVAGLFRLFGQSVLVARLSWAAELAIGGVGIFILARRLAGLKWAAAALAVSVLWGESLGIKTLLTVWSTWLLLPLFERRLRWQRALAAGFLAGLATLYRYDTGFGLAATHVFIITIAVWLTEADAKHRLGTGAAALWPYLLGFAIPVAPLIIAYLATGTMHDFLYDVVTHNERYYHAGRNLPFPHVHRRNFEESAVYTVPVLFAMGFYGTWRRVTRRGEGRGPRCIPEWVGAMIAFAAVGGVMYLKAFVRIGVGQLYMALSPCILLVLVLCVHRNMFDRMERAALGLIVFLFVAAGVFPTVNDLRYEHQQRSSIMAWILNPAAQNPPPPFDRWCRENNVVSKGFCFFPDDDHIQAIEYLNNHTKSGDTLYVGLPHHDRVLVNDNLIYFATQRLPATKWTQFEPYEQNREDLQHEMVGELERNQPPYVVLDSEFENQREPNGSSVSTGVHLLDDYIATHYLTEKKFGEMTILKRR